MPYGNVNPIFVVDDDQGILDSFEAMLGDDYPLVMVNNVSDALELLGEYEPRLLFLDLKIPHRNGFHVLKWIQENRLATNVVVVTGLANGNYEESANQYGIYRYLRKPLDVDEVENIAREILN
jgi:DNA-binding NtrC family response regulator